MQSKFNIKQKPIFQLNFSHISTNFIFSAKINKYVPKLAFKSETKMQLDRIHPRNRHPFLFALKIFYYSFSFYFFIVSSSNRVPAARILFKCLLRGEFQHVNSLFFHTFSLFLSYSIVVVFQSLFIFICTQCPCP